MSAIVGYRDKLLQAAPIRNIAPASSAFLLLTADTPVFHVTVDSAGNPVTGSPSVINLTATLFNLAADVVFTVTSGTATLTGSGLTRQLAYSGMTTNTVTVRASATYSGVTFFMDLVISKVIDGAKGVPGSTGVNGKSARIAFTLVDGFSLNYNPLTVTVTGDTRPATGTWGETRAWQAAIDSAPVAGQAWFQTNGTYDVTANTTVWTTPYMSNLKVGNLSALTVNTGALIFTDTCQSANGNFKVTSAGVVTISSSDGDGTSVQTNKYLRFYATNGQLRISIGVKP